MWPELYRHHLIGFVGVVVGHFRHLQDLGQNISPLFRATDRSRPNLGVSFKFGVETFGERTNREPSIGLRYLDLMRSSTVVVVALGVLNVERRASRCVGIGSARGKHT